MKSSASIFRELHNNETPLVLPLAWDAASAKIIETAGAKAIATSSAAVSWGLGYADGNNVPFLKFVCLAEDILRVINLPLSVDVESGFSDDPAIVAQNVNQLVDLGVAGINLEDNIGSFEVLLEKIRKIREVLGDKDLYINFRTDVYLQSLVSPDKQVEETIRRGKAAKDAGADGLFIPGLNNIEVIKTIADQVQLPIHVMAWDGLPEAAGLADAGVKRLSDGSRLAASVWKFTADAAAEFLKTADSKPLLGGDWSLQQAFAK
ncbi:isocitrate lyase/phosphoenolpyruvate mutase family protein [Mucilaginibacter sp. SG564]|uniref:isocitrate lyase/PEP mutase family protein n=1 Tax=Mucilaginibacter sp. SG564 TaxID=2587022 RepID=UPI001551E58B|nr:isocitrate lyase/phosphoenolpyruvate mutase family protein [Mucilaginibacter sp. SG564]NOW96005.1 2-methylisocitrate lyase-like PEP mutase family enzyme [Mucilaginibacter sp. SG564]